MKKIILLEKLKGVALPTNFEDKDIIDLLLKKNPKGYKKSDYHNALSFVQSVLDKPYANEDKSISIVGRIFEVNFFGIESIEFTYCKHIARAA